MSNISSMRELHKLYEPPVPRHQIPLNNPFFNNQIASRISQTNKSIDPRSLDQSKPSQSLRLSLKN